MKSILYLCLILIIFSCGKDNQQDEMEYGFLTSGKWIQTYPIYYEPQDNYTPWAYPRDSLKALPNECSIIFNHDGNYIQNDYEENPFLHINSVREYMTKEGTWEKEDNKIYHTPVSNNGLSIDSIGNIIQSNIFATCQSYYQSDADFNAYFNYEEDIIYSDSCYFTYYKEDTFQITLLDSTKLSRGLHWQIEYISEDSLSLINYRYDYYEFVKEPN